jgi:hypothetical protein
VPVFPIGFGGGADPAYLGRLADATRGRYFAASQADIGGVYATIADQLRGQYALTLRSPVEADGAEGSLVVTAEVDGQRVASAPAVFTRGVAPVVPPPVVDVPPETASSDDGGGSAMALIVAGVVGAVLVVGVVALLLMRRAAAARRQRLREQGAGRQSETPLPPPIPGAPVAHAHDERAAVCGVSGDLAGHTFHFGGTPLVFGTDPKADVRLGRSREVAPRHAMLWVRDGKIMLRHTGGARQTLSAGRPVDWLILEEGDEFSIGPHRWRIEAPGSASTNGSEAASAGRDASS